MNENFENDVNGIKNDASPAANVVPFPVFGVEVTDLTDDVEVVEPAGEMPTGQVIEFPLEQTRPSLGGLEVTDLTDDVEVVEGAPSSEGMEGEATSEDFENGEGIASAASDMYELALAPEASPTLRAQAVANAFASADPELAPFLEAPQQQGGLEFTDWVAKKGRKLLALVSLAGGLSALPSIANAGGVWGRMSPQFGYSQTVNSMEQGGRAYIRYQEIGRQQDAYARQIQTLESQIEQIELQKAQASTQAGVNQRVSSIERDVDARVRPQEIEARHNAEKAAIKLEKVTAKERFQQIPNPSATDVARYDAAMAKLSAKEVRIDGEYEKALAREQGNVEVRGMQIGVQGYAAHARVDQQTMRQERLGEQIQRLRERSRMLEIEKLRIGGAAVGIVIPR
jgi:hypothetical protein